MMKPSRSRYRDRYVQRHRSWHARRGKKVFEVVMDISSYAFVNSHKAMLSIVEKEKSTSARPRSGFHSSLYKRERALSFFEIPSKKKDVSTPLAQKPKCKI